MGFGWRLEMANRVQNFFESIVYAGMKPGARSSAEAPAAKSGWLARFLNAPAPSDPLYLTNRSFGQKARRVLAIASPFVLVIAGGLAAFLFFGHKTDKAPKELTSAEVRAKVLPGFNKEFKLDSNKDLEIAEIHFESNGPSVMVGSIRNTTDHAIFHAVVVFELADSSRSDLGAVTVTETNLAPGASRIFRKPIEQTNAASALVREVETR
jgi:hypothetical protein